MGSYTEYLDENIDEIHPDDDDYEERLLEAARLFRPFSEALTSFLQSHGYDGPSDDPDGAAAFLRQKFVDAGIPVPRGLKSWFTGGSRMSRDTALQTCFAFHLTPEQAGAFFRNVCLDRGLDCHAYRETVCCFCLSRGLDWNTAQDLIARIPKPKTVRMQAGMEVLYTGTILEQLRTIRTPDELVSYISSSLDRFGYNNATAGRYIQDLWDEISRPGGLAFKEGLAVPGPKEGPDAPVRTAAEGDSVWAVLSQILGLDRATHDRLVEERSIKSILKDNDLLHPLAEASFPDRDGIQKVLNGFHISNERVRKLLILLSFYRYWAEQRILKGYSTTAGPEDQDRCLDEMNQYLMDAGYPELYCGNPYDWIFLWALKDGSPLDAFREYILELAAYKSEHMEG